MRPLPKPMLEYALTDSFLLLPAFYHYMVLEAEKQKNRVDFVEEVQWRSNSLIKNIKLQEYWYPTVANKIDQH